MAAPAYRSSGTVAATTSSSTNITPGAPAGATNNDILTLFTFARGDDEIGDMQDISANGTGWSEITSGFLDIGSTGLFVRGWWYRVSGSPPTMPSVSHPDLASNLLTAQVHAYSGCITSGNPYEDPDTALASLAAWAGVAVTTTGADRLIVQMWGADDNTTGNPASGWTENNESSASSPLYCLATDSKTRASAGTESAPTRSNGVERNGCIGFALIPEPPASTFIPRFSTII